MNSKNGFSNFCESTSGSGNIRIKREIVYTAISYFLATNDPIGMKVSAFERGNQGEFFI